MKKKQKKLFLLSITAASLALPVAGHAQEAIKFGMVTSLTGPFTPWGGQVRDGMKMAIQEINDAGGVLGRKMALVERDDKNNPTEGVTALRYLVEREGVVAAGGVISSDVGLALAREAESLRTPFFLTMSGANEALKKSSRYTFRTCLPPASEGISAVANFIKEKKYTRVGALMADYAWGHSNQRAIEQEIKPLPGVNLQLEVAPVREADFTPYLRKLQALDPQVIVAHGHPPGNPTITRQAAELGMKTLVIGSWYPTSDFIVQKTGDALYGRFADFTCVDFESPAYKELAAKYNKQYKSVLDIASFSGYVMVKMVANAIQKTKSTDHKAIADAIRAGTFEQPGYGWKLSYTEWGEMKEAAPILYVYEQGDPGAVNAGGKWRTKVIFRSPPVQPYVPQD